MAGFITDALRRKQSPTGVANPLDGQTDGFVPPTHPQQDAMFESPLPNVEGGGEGIGVGNPSGGLNGDILPPPPPVDIENPTGGGGDLDPVDPPDLYGDDPVDLGLGGKHPVDPIGGGGGGGDLNPTDPVGGGLGGLKDALLAKLTGLINRGPNNAATKHAQDVGRQMLAERNAAEGINDSGGADSRFLGLQQDIARNAQQDNDAMILQALGLGGNFVNSQEGLNLQQALQESGLNLQQWLAILNALQQQGAGAF